MVGATPQDIPTRRGRYELGELLGRGGMGEVFAGCVSGAHGFSKPVAIKRLLPEIANDHVFVQRLIGEAKLLVNIQHGNIVSVLDLVRDGNDVFLVMEFVDGPSLSQLLKTHRKLSLGVSTYIVQSAAAGLEYAHARPSGAVIHADVSPSNLLLTSAGEVRVADFGIAHQEGMTTPGVVEGKWAYMAPEQASGEPLTPRSDVFALGIVLYQLISGRHPFKAGAIAGGHVPGAYVVPPNMIEPSIPIGLSHACMCAIAPEPRDRFRSMQELIDALVDQRFANGWREGASDLARLIADVPNKLQAETQFTRKPLTIMTQSLISASARKRPSANELNGPQHAASESSLSTTSIVEPIAEAAPPLQTPQAMLAGFLPGMGQHQRGSVPDMGQHQRGSVPDMGQHQRGSVPDMGQLQRGSVPDFGQLQRGSVPDMLQRSSLPNMGQPIARTSLSSFQGGELVYGAEQPTNARHRTVLVVVSAMLVGVIAAFAISQYVGRKTDTTQVASASRTANPASAEPVPPSAVVAPPVVTAPPAVVTAPPAVVTAPPTETAATIPPAVEKVPTPPPPAVETPAPSDTQPASPTAAVVAAPVEPAKTTSRAVRKTDRTAKPKRKANASRTEVAPKPEVAQDAAETAKSEVTDAVLSIRTIPAVEAKITIDNRDTTIHGQVPGGKFTLTPGRYHVMLSNPREGVWVDCGKQSVEAGKKTVLVVDVKDASCKIDR